MPGRWQPCKVGLLALTVWMLVLVVWAVPRHVQPGDAGEFATVLLRGGVPHPSGYPWMRILGLVARPLAWLGIAPATAAALPCALAGAAAWLVLHPLLCRAAGSAVATFVLAYLGSAATVVLHTHDSEVWGPHLLLCAIVLRLAFARRPVDPLVLGVAIGIAVTHHLTAVLLVPLVVGAAWPDRSGWRTLGRAGGRGLAGAAVGLLALGTLAIGDGGAWRWGDTRTLAGLVHHVSRADYGVLSLSLHPGTVSVGAQWARTLGSVGRTLTAGLTDAPLPAAVLLIALVAMAWRLRPATLRRSPAIGLGVTLVASVLGFTALHDIDPGRGFGAWILERFDLLPILLLAMPLAVALHRLAAWAPTARARVLLGALAVGLLALQWTHTARRGVAADDAFVEGYAVDLLRTPPPGAPALIFGTDDHRTFPVLFAQAVLGEGPQVIYVDASLLAHPWYRARLRRQWPQLPDVDKPVRLMGAIWNDPALAATPIYLANDFSRHSASLARVPEGILWRVLPPPGLTSIAPPDPLTVLARHRAAFSRYRRLRGPGLVPPGHPFTADLAAHYNDPTAQLVTALSAAGYTAQARALATDLE